MNKVDNENLWLRFSENYDSNGIQSEGFPRLDQAGEGETVPYEDFWDRSVGSVNVCGSDFRRDPYGGSEKVGNKGGPYPEGTYLFRNARIQVGPYGIRPLIRVVPGGSSCQVVIKGENFEIFDNIKPNIPKDRPPIRTLKGFK